MVNWNGVFPGIVLLDSSQEGLCEVETRHPEDRRRSILVPVLFAKYHDHNKHYRVIFNVRFEMMKLKVDRSPIDKDCR